jgi:type 1 glutamine amidotransferase
MEPNILVICGDRYHPADVIMNGLRGIFGDTLKLVQAPDGPLTDIDAEATAIVLAKSNALSPTELDPWEDTVSSRLVQQFVESGRGLLVIHAGTVGYKGAIRQMTGGSFERHPEACAVGLEPIANHPITKGVAPFEVHDEHYLMRTDENLEVFLCSRSESGVQPAGWTQTVGEGRICVLTPGHFEDVWGHLSFGLLVRNALSWVSHE